MIKKRIKQIRKKFQKYGIDGYIIPKNDEFFSEYSNKDRLKTISNFSGSAGYAVILKKKNYLFVDGRYSIQARLEAGDNFKIIGYERILDCNLFKNLTIGIDPQLFTSEQISKFFNKNNFIKEIKKNLIDNILPKKSLKKKRFYSLDDKIVGEGYKKKIDRISKFLKLKKLDYLFITAPENVAWLLNIRGYDNPCSPIPNCRLFLDKKKNFFLISEKRKVKDLILNNRITKNQFISTDKYENFLNKIKKGKIIIDQKSCSIFYENLLKKRFKVIKGDDPIHFFKSIKNKFEINHSIKAHIADGVALTKFLYWIKKVNKKSLTEFDAQKKLESFRKKNKNYLFPSFDTIAGTGKNGAIVHYKVKKKTALTIKKKDIFLCDSGGQYKYGTTDVTRTICFSKPKKSIKNIFTRILKGHIAVATADLKKNFNGKLIDKLARKYLNQIGLDYEHGTGHGVGFYLNVHEGPQSITKFNKIKLVEGMILSNEPGYYKKNSFGIRIENLIYVKKSKNKLHFQNLTMAPIEKELIDQKLLNQKEKSYLFKYNLEMYSRLSEFLTKSEKKWLSSFF